jgi:membrane protein required for colicin V production
VTVIDFIVILFLGFCLLQGFWKGAVRESISLLAVCLGLITAFNYYGLAGAKLTSLAHIPLPADTAGFVAVYLLVWLMVKLAGWSFSHGEKEKKPSSTSRLGGVMLGLARGVIIVSLVFLFAELNFPHNKITSPNYLTPYLLRSAGFCLEHAPFMPPHVSRPLKYAV